MAYEIDHLFICTSIGAPEADPLVRLGFIEGSPNRHEGQGTRNRRFFFTNSMLELLWIDDAAEACGELARPTRLWDRWQGRHQNCSPFGVCLRATSDTAEPPFVAWEYRPAFLPSHLMIHMAEGAPLIEPLWFFIANGQRPDATDVARREPIEHPLGVRELTGVHLVWPGVRELSSAARAVVNAGLVTIAAGPEHLLQLTFDDHRVGQQCDCRPDLPLVMLW